MASAVSMDKDVQKRLCREWGLPVVEYVVAGREEIEAGEVRCELPFPMFVKPANLGSSVGISKAHNCAELKAALKLAAQYDRKVLIERGVEGREFECGVLGNQDPRASMPCEILPSREFYDYEDKYELNLARTVVPPDLPEDQIAEMQRLAVECFRAVGCEGMGRVDFLRETATGRFFINEINTVPGFTSISMYPKMWEYSGVPYPELIARLIDLALERHRVKSETRFTR
jgi:D-alanine-D-alanine ligase